MKSKRRVSSLLELYENARKVRSLCYWQVSLVAMESANREVKDVKVIGAGDSGRGFWISCPVECVRPSDDDLEGLHPSWHVFVRPSFRESLHGSTMDVMA